MPYPRINPVLFRIGPLHVRWYGLMYVLGFLISYFLIKHQEKTRPVGLSPGLIQDLLFYLAIGLLAGGRLGYIVFYQYMNLPELVRDPLEIIAVWHGGMSFHGGLLGAVFAGWWFCKRKKLSFWAVADRVIVTVPIALGLGRIGNFINGELFGRPSNVPWAMVFPGGGPLARHPSQLYEALMEGAVLFIVLWLLRRRAFREGMMVGFFLFFYGIFRFFLEFFRDPDAQLGFILGPFTMGQVLSMTMILCAVLIAVLTGEQWDRNNSAMKKRRKSEKPKV
ncbi:MAG: prolipoprotein diacylglyceryl transferase [Deltaproteobacteria bacterium]|nr:prolipoprotein diacylglyceryl transferase [Deltaproteobacteria bacterium]